ncbi:hypothetical protein [Chitinophaga sp. Cy-1792]|uniref:hypothetical protein n=1 Tax=Chitinophaga sp. Cy-1792 TaxID=2608339 RepID=UPI0019624A5E|nr:hypothetical protein [Chitinophaga sp. Cy-1792]
MNIPRPPYRKLRGYAFDPAFSQQADTADFNEIVYKIPWENLSAKPGNKADAGSAQGPGPVGEYIEVVDFDPTTKQFYQPVDLNDPYLLAQDGLPPSESNPQFHQQMVYAVAMTTIRNFERALGRKVIWAPRRKNGLQDMEYVQRLRIYPHALRAANAYYSPVKKALLFGYFSAMPADNSLQMPGSLVFTCLSHDIIAHETTHAILDGMHRQYNLPTNPDVLAFHEAFADIVALFQHFSFPEVLKKQLADTKGDLAAQNSLGKLAQQFGMAVGNYGSLRDAIGYTDEAGVWHPKKPEVDEYRTIMEPHARGSILVAAIFEAFINIYKKQVADLLRIATNGTGILPQGELHPDLVNRLAAEAAKIANQVLQMCIRALDYCPPVDITFGDFLRAIITADIDLVADDNRNYRLFFIDAFRRRGIYPDGIKNLSVDSLRHSFRPFTDDTLPGLLKILADFLREFRADLMYETDRKEIYLRTKGYMGKSYDKKDERHKNQLPLHERLGIKFEGSSAFEKLTGLIFNNGWENLGIRTSTVYGTRQPSFYVQNLRLISRIGPDGNQINQIIFSIIQRSGVLLDSDGNFNGTYKRTDEGTTPENGFELYGGCTLIFDLDTLQLKYVISKPLLDMELLERGDRKIDRKRVESQHQFKADASLNMTNGFFGDTIDLLSEPFAFLHQH